MTFTLIYPVFNGGYWSVGRNGQTLTPRQRRQWHRYKRQQAQVQGPSVQTTSSGRAARSSPRSQGGSKRLSRQQVRTAPKPKNRQGHRQVDSQSLRKSQPTPKLSPLAKTLLSTLRLLILGVGVAAIAGTILAILNPGGKISGGNKADQTASATPAPVAQATPNPLEPVLKPDLEMGAVKQKVQALAKAQPELTPGMFFLNLDTGAYLNLAGATTFSAASMIKVPVLVAFFQDVDAGKIRLDEMLIMRPDLIGSGSGEMQYLSPNSKFTALETATKMIVISDNTATNILIDRLGGAAQLNQRFKTWGLTKSVIHNPLPDLEGTNTTTPQELAMLMSQVSQGDLVTPRSRDRLLDIMRQTETNTLLPQGLGDGATIAHKTGDIGTLVGDVGVIDLPNGQRYVAAAMVKRPFNDDRAQELIRQISKLTYQVQVQASPQPGEPSPVSQAN